MLGHPHSGKKSGVAARPAGEFVSVTTDRLNPQPIAALRERLQSAHCVIAWTDHPSVSYPGSIGCFWPVAALSDRQKSAKS
ncbi:hypothetical protein D3C84_413860 [compost metagenome]